MADLEGFLWFNLPHLKPEETVQDKSNGHALNLYRPTNLYIHTAIEVNSYLDTSEFFLPGV